MHVVPRISENTLNVLMRRLRAVAHNTLLTIIAWCVVLVLLGRVIQRAWQGLQVYSLHLSFELLLISALLLVAAFLNGALGWHLLLRTMGVQHSWKKDMATWLVAQAAKYLPAGTVWYFGGRFLQGKRNGLDSATVSLALAMEFAFYLGGAFVLFGLSLGLWPDVAWGWQVSVGVLALSVLWWLLSPRLVRLACRWLHHQGDWRGDIAQPLQRMGGSGLRQLSLFYLLQWMLIGQAFWFLVASLYPVTPTRMLALGGVFSLSSALGYLVFLIPGGWGVREQALALLLGHFIPFPLGATVSILARLWYTIVEGVCMLLGWVIHRTAVR